jgi:hypothetical protein
MISKAGQDLARYFPEVVAEALALSERHFLLDGELVVPNSKHFSFDRLLQRIHPATSRIKKLSHDTPALFIAFDLLSRGNRRLDRANLDERREVLEEFTNSNFCGTRFRLSPSSRKLSVARGNGCRPRGAAAMASSPSGVICPISLETAKACRRSRSIEAPIASSAVFAMANAAWRAGRSSVRCCSASMMMTACFTTLDSLQPSRKRTNLP